VYDRRDPPERERTEERDRPPEWRGLPEGEASAEQGKSKATLRERDQSDTGQARAELGEIG
jgi:hypothetical protein